MGRQKRYKDPVRFSLQLERHLVAQLDELAQAYGVERNILIDRILRKQATTGGNPFALEAHEDPGKYGEPAPDTATRLPTADDTIPGAKSAG